MLFNIDVTVFNFINHSLQNSFFDFIMPIITNINTWRIPVIICWLLLFFLGGKKGKIVGLICLVTLLLTDQVSSHLLKPLFARVRPYQFLPDVINLIDAGSFSFPSSHAANTMGAATIIFSFYRKPGIGVIVLSCVVGFSRIYLGVHYPGDILGGFILGFIIALTILQAHKYFTPWVMSKLRKNANKE